MGFRIKTSERACSAVQVSCGGDQIDVYVGTSDAKLIALANGYVKLEPGQVVVDGREHDLALHMAAKWAEHVAGNDRGVTFTRTSNLEARDE